MFTLQQNDLYLPVYVNDVLYKNFLSLRRKILYTIQKIIKGLMNEQYQININIDIRDYILHKTLCRF